MTNNYFNSAHKESEIGEIFPIQDGKETIENFGDIDIKFISLSNLLNEIPPISLDDLEDNRRNFKLMVNIKSPIQFVHQMLTDQKQKLKWIPGIKDIKESSYINRINSSHTCVFDNLEVHFVTRRNEVKKDSMIYGENIELKSGLSFVSDFKLVSVDSGTDVYLKVTPGKPNYNLKGIKKVFWILKANIVLIVLNRSNKKSMKYFKRFVEEEFQKNKN
jgi:ABC-type molybdate transport system substrate-binding protein